MDDAQHSEPTVPLVAANVQARAIDASRCGALGQPAVAARTAVLLRRLTWGLVSCLAALVLLLAASVTLLRFDGGARMAPAVANVCAVLALLVCLMQWWVWRRAQLEWRGVRDVNLAGWLVPSRVGAWFAGPVGLVGAVAAARVVRATGSAETAHWLALTGALLLVVGVALGCLEPLDPVGPRGTLPQVLERNLHPGRRRVVVDPHADTVVLERRSPASPS